MKTYVARLTELKQKVKVLESKQLELEAAGAKKMEIGRVIEQAVELARQFQTAFAQGTIEEKRLFIRAFVSKIEIDPLKKVGLISMIIMPGLEKMVGNDAGSYPKQEVKIGI